MPSRKSVEAVVWGQNRVRKLELENENLTKTILALSNSPDPTSTESGEEIHQRRRRERMLDQVTLICVRDGIERIQRTLDIEQDYGRDNRNTADNICHGINGFDAFDATH
jgi:hypothetical protein